MQKMRKIWWAKSEKYWTTWFLVPFLTPFSASILGVKESRYAKFNINSLNVSSLDFMKIQSDFHLLFSFPRYSRLKSGPVSPETYPAQDLGPNISRTRFFPDMRFSPQSREGLDLTPYWKSGKSNDRFSRKFRKTSIFTIFGTFFKFFGKPDFFSKIGLCHFLFCIALYFHVQFHKKIMNGFWDIGVTDRQTDRQTWAIA